MDGDRFDKLVRHFAVPRTRRRFLAGLTGAFGSLVGLRESGLAATRRGPGKICNADAHCTAGSRCLADRTGRRYCTCTSGSKPCGNTCISQSACCRNSECASFTSTCTTGVCVAGACQAKPKRNGAVCPGGACCDGACTTCCRGIGQCDQCTTVADCLTPETECRTNTCLNGICGSQYVAAGTATTNQTTGDCQRDVCDGSGGMTKVVDVSDLPAAATDPCSQAVCTNGNPSYTSLPSGTPCDYNGGRVCDGAGTCVGCLSASDCPGEDTDCETVICSNGACGLARVAVGTPVSPSSQTAGNCKKIVCDGLGGTIEVHDNTDTPTNSEPCQPTICVNGVPTSDYAEPGTVCGDGLVCNGVGTCVECLTDLDCPVSTACQIAGCLNGACTLVSTVAGTPCAENGGSVCDGNGACVACLSPTDCPGSDTECQTRTCQAGTCGFSYTPAGTPITAQTLGDCQRTVCDGAGSTTTVADDDDRPDDGNQCTQNLCLNGQPDHPPVTDGLQCDQGGTICANGSCLNVLGAPCQTGLECASGYCVDSVCCDNICSGTCEGCTAALKGTGEDGVCGSIAAGTDPHDECPGVRMCDGNGACDGCDTPADCPGDSTDCQTITCEDGICGAVAAQSGTPTTQQTAGDCQKDVCDGQGGTTTANDNLDLPDDGNQCTANICTDGTPSNPPLPLGTECNQNGGVICDGNGACVKQKLLGSACSASVECSSGFCADGVCCDSACDSTCRACTAELKGTGSDGVCGIVEPGTDPHGECPDTSVCNDVGECSGCLDASSCPGETSECQQPTCDNGVCGTSYTPAFTPISNQVAGDCKALVCDGAGGVMSVNDDADVPTGDTNCILSSCSNGVPIQITAQPGTSCNDNGGSVCNDQGVCVGCNASTDCPVTSECETATCVDGQCSTTNAPVGTLCQNNNKICDGSGNCLSQFLNGSACQASIQCSGGYCVDGYCCNSPCSAECRACNLPGLLGFCSISVGETCDGGLGVCDSSGTCNSVI